MTVFFRRMLTGFAAIVVVFGGIEFARADFSWSKLRHEHIDTIAGWILGFGVLFGWAYAMHARKYD